VNREAEGSKFFEELVEDIFPLSFAAAEKLARTMDETYGKRTLKSLDLAAAPACGAFHWHKEPEDDRHRRRLARTCYRSRAGSSERFEVATTVQLHRRRHQHVDFGAATTRHARAHPSQRGRSRAADR
jgi:hypothetical protein